MIFNEKVKKMDGLDLGLTKLSVAAIVLFIITIWTAAMNWVHSVNPWYFLIVFILAAARPLYRVYLK